MGPHVRTWGVPEIEHSVLLGDSTQLMPLPPGNGSLMVTPVASAAPPFVIVIVKPMFAPAFTEAASAVLRIVKLGAFRTFHSSKPPSLPHVFPSGEAPVVVPHLL